MLEPLKGLSPGSTASFFGQRLLLSPSVADAVPSVPASLQSSHQACSSTFCIEATDHSVGGGASVPSAQVPDARSFPNGPLGAEPQPAQLLGEGDEDSSIALKRTKVLWAKALWWATQEARRRKAQQIADQQQVCTNDKFESMSASTILCSSQWVVHQSVLRPHTHAHACTHKHTIAGARKGQDRCAPSLHNLHGAVAVVTEKWKCHRAARRGTRRRRWSSRREQDGFRRRSVLFRNRHNEGSFRRRLGCLGEPSFFRPRPRDSQRKAEELTFSTISPSLVH